MHLFKSKATTERGGAPALPSPPTTRLYPIDIITLSLLDKDGYGYAKTISQRLKRTQRTITKHLRKLEIVHLIERHGTPRCPFQWYSINERARTQIKYLTSYFNAACKTAAGKAAPYLTFKILLDHAPTGRPAKVLVHKEQTLRILAPREYNDPGRPGGKSVPWLFLVPNRLTGLFPLDLKVLNRRDKLESSLLERGMRDLKELFDYPIGKVGPPDLEKYNKLERDKSIGKNP